MINAMQTCPIIVRTCVTAVLVSICLCVCEATAPSININIISVSIWSIGRPNVGRDNMTSRLVIVFYFPIFFSPAFLQNN